MSAAGHFANVQAAINQWLVEVGRAPLVVDGRSGSKSDSAYASLSAAALAEYRDKLRTPSAPMSGDVVAESPNRWPLEADAASFFGYPPNLTQIQPPYPMRMYDGGWQAIHAITCNVKVAASLRSILAGILDHYGSVTAVQEVGLDVYDGCYADRNVRGSSTKRSMHAYGAAIDFDAEHNPLGATTGRMPAEVVAIFHAAGWRWGGDYTGRKDWMHFEACR